MVGTPSLAEFIDKQLADLKTKWDGGHYPAAIEALGWCVPNNHPLPLWLGEAANAALLFTFENAGGDGNRRKGGFRAQTVRSDNHEARWRAAKHWLDCRDQLPAFGFSATRAGAFECASEILAGSPYQGSPGAIEESYEKVQALNKSTPPI